MKRGDSSDHKQTRVNKRTQSQEEPRIYKGKFEKGGGSQNEKPKYVTCGKMHYGKCLAGTSGYYGCGKDDHKVIDCPIIADRGRESKKVTPSAPKDDAPTKRHFYVLQNRGEKPKDGDDDEGKSLHFIFRDMSSF